MRLIDADKEIRHYERDYLCPTPDVKDFEKRNAIIIVNALKKMETVESRPKGKWMQSPTAHYYCSNCHCYPHDDYSASTLGMNYCPNCGADMRGEE